MLIIVKAAAERNNLVHVQLIKKNDLQNAAFLKTCRIESQPSDSCLQSASNLFRLEHALLGLSVSSLFF